jgi:glycosyltransferase involved in cell wall biosynthesis
VDVVIDNHKHDTTTIELDEFWSRELPSRVDSKSASIKIWHETPEFYHPNPGQINVAMVAWETSHIPNQDIGGATRNNWVAQINKMDECWTFCNFAKKAMLDSGVHTPIRVIPHPLDHKTYHPINKEDRVELFDSSRHPLHDGWFKFMSVFQWTPRKDPFSLILAYLSEFTRDEDVALILKTYVNQAGDLAQVKNQIESIKKGSKLPHESPRIFLVPGLLTDQEMADLVRAADVTVLTTKGEGFCLPAAESLACGTPTIVPRGSAFTDYMSESVGYFVDVHPEPVYGMPHIPWYYSSQLWHRVDIMNLRERMREAFTDRKALQERAGRCAEAVSEFTTANVGSQMRKALEALLASQTREPTRVERAFSKPASSPVKGL